MDREDHILNRSADGKNIFCPIVDPGVIQENGDADGRISDDGMVLGERG